MVNNQLRDDFGIHLLKVLNSIKQTPESFSKSNSIDINKLIDVIRGRDKPKRELLNILANHKVINFNEFLNPANKESHISNKDIDIKMTCLESQKTTRTFSRGDSYNKFDYYHYSDLAASKHACILPEHIIPIQETKFFLNKFNKIPKWAFNNGHLEHQITYFCGEIDFHWIENGQIFSKKMKDGEMNYIFPYTPHTFTTRKYGSYIAAVTYKSIINSELGFNLISNTRTNKGETLFDCVKNNQQDDNNKKNYVIFSKSIKKIKEWDLFSKCCSPIIKYGNNDQKENRINESWVYHIKPSLNLKSKSAADFDLLRTIGDSHIQTGKEIKEIKNNSNFDFIEIGLNRPKIISLKLIRNEVNNFVNMHGVSIINRLISDNLRWF